MTVAKKALDAGAGTLSAALRLLYPPHCPLCEVPLDGDDAVQSRFVCRGCLGGIEKLSPPWCARCGEPFERAGDLCGRCAHGKIPFEQARSYGPYDGGLARLIQLLKFGRERALARDLSELLAQLACDERLVGEIEAITFVPMSRKDQWARGFNHAQLLAQHLGRRLELPVQGTLRKVRVTRPQVELSERERLLNLRDAFAPLGPLPFEVVLLIDDVYTTGATVAECSKTLREVGVEKVFVLTLARTPLDPSDGNENERRGAVEGS